MTITREQLEADKALCERSSEGPWILDRPGGSIVYADDTSYGEDCIVAKLEDPDDAAFIARARTAIPEYIAELEATRERIDQVEYIDLAAYLHNHGLPCTVEALATRRLFLDVLRGTEQGKAPSELEALQARYDALFALAEKIIDTEQHAGQPYSDARLVRGDYIKELRQFVRGAK